MRILHTSDWHLGRSFHGHSTVPQLREVLGAFPGLVREHAVDVVVVAGDVFDHAAPAAGLYELLAWAIRGIRDAGAAVVMISGNHDNAIRLGFQSEWAALGGVHVLTRPDGFREPLTLSDTHGPVDFYGVPFLEPMLQQNLYPGERLRSHAALLGRVMEEVDGLRAERESRSVAVSHCFAVGGTGGAAAGGGAVDAADVGEVGERDDAGEGLVWDLTAGGLDYVPAEIFAGADYAALGHLHGRAVLADGVRYSGAPLHFSFSESQKPRGAWLVDLGAEGLSGVEWLRLPVPRPLVRLRGTLDELLDPADHAEYEPSWIEATLTDRVRPVDAMRRLRDRFPHCARIEFDPQGAQPAERRSYGSRVAGRTDIEVIDEFLRHVREGVGADEPEREVLTETLAEAGHGGVQDGGVRYGSASRRVGS